MFKKNKRFKGAKGIESNFFNRSFIIVPAPFDSVLSKEILRVDFVAAVDFLDPDVELHNSSKVVRFELNMRNARTARKKFQPKKSGKFFYLFYKYFLCNYFRQ